SGQERTSTFAVAAAASSKRISADESVIPVVYGATATRTPLSPAARRARTAHTAKVATASPTRAPIAASAFPHGAKTMHRQAVADGAMGARVGLAMATFAVCAV